MLTIIMTYINYCLSFFFLTQNRTVKTFSKTSTPNERNKTKLLFCTCFQSIVFWALNF